MTTEDKIKALAQQVPAWVDNGWIGRFSRNTPPTATWEQAVDIAYQGLEDQKRANSVIGNIIDSRGVQGDYFIIVLDYRYLIQAKELLKRIALSPFWRWALQVSNESARDLLHVVNQLEVAIRPEDFRLIVNTIFTSRVDQAVRNRSMKSTLP